MGRIPKLHTALFSIGAGLALAGCQTSAGDLAPEDFTPDDRAAIEAASQLWVETYNRNDWSALAALFTPDGVIMPPNGPAVSGRAGIADWEAANEAGFGIAFDIDTIAGSGDMAYVSGRSCVFIPDGRGGYGVDVGKFLEIRRRGQTGDWLIVRDAFNSDLALGGKLAKACPFSERPPAG